MITQFHTKNSDLGIVTQVLNEDPLLDTQGVTGSSPVSPSDVSRCVINTYDALTNHFTTTKTLKLAESVSLGSSERTL